MKKKLLVIGALAFTMAAPTLTAQQPEPQTTPAAQPVAPSEAELERAINRYLYLGSARSLEQMADAMEASDGSSLSQLKILVRTLDGISDYPLEGFPEEYVAFYNEYFAVGKDLVAEMDALIAQVEAGALAEDELLEKLQPKLLEVQRRQREVEAKYPEPAKRMGTEASIRLSHKIVPQLQAEALPLILEYAEAHPDLDRQQMQAAALRITAKLMREKAAGL